LKHETINSGSEVLFKRPSSELSKLELAYKVIQSGMYWWALVIGGLASFAFVTRGRANAEAALLGLMCIYSIVACPFIMRAAEIRYMIPVFPLLLGASIWYALGWWERLRMRSTRTSTTADI
jgi:fatty acid desaturase